MKSQEEAMKAYEDEVEVAGYKLNKCYADTVGLLNTAKTLHSAPNVQEARNFIIGRMTPNFETKLPVCTFAENTMLLKTYTAEEDEKIKQKYTEIIREIDSGKLKTTTQVFDAAYTKTLEIIEEFKGKIAEFEKHFKEDVESNVKGDLSKLNAKATKKEQLAAEKELRAKHWAVINANMRKEERSKIFAELEYEKGISDFSFWDISKKRDFYVRVNKHLNNALTATPSPKEVLGFNNYMMCMALLLLTYENLGKVAEAKALSDELENIRSNAKSEDPNAVYHVELSLGTFYQGNHKWEHAIKAFTNSFKAAERGKVENGSTVALISKGTTYTLHHKANENDLRPKKAFANHQHNELPGVALQCYREAFEYLFKDSIVPIARFIKNESESFAGLEYIANFYKSKKNFQKALEVRELIDSIFVQFVTISKSPDFPQDADINKKIAQYLIAAERNTTLINVAKEMIKKQATQNKEAAAKKQKEAELLLEAGKDYDNSFSNRIKEFEVEEKAAEVKTKSAIEASERRTKDAAGKIMVSRAKGASAERSGKDTKNSKSEVPTQKQSLATQSQPGYNTTCNQGVSLLAEKKFDIAETRFASSLMLSIQKNDKPVEALSYWGLAECDAAKAREALGENNTSGAVDCFSKSLHYVGKGVEAIKSANSNNQDLLDTLRFMSTETTEILKSMDLKIKASVNRKLLQCKDSIESREDKKFEMGRNCLKREKNRESENLWVRSKNKENLSQEEIDIIYTKGCQVWHSNPNPKNVEANEREKLNRELQEEACVSEKVSNVLAGFGYVSEAIKTSRPIESSMLEKYTGIRSVEKILQSDFPGLPSYPKEETEVTRPVKTIPQPDPKEELVEPKPEEVAPLNPKNVKTKESKRVLQGAGSISKGVSQPKVELPIASSSPALPSPKEEVVEHNPGEVATWRENILSRRANSRRERSKSVNDLESPQRDRLIRRESDPCLLR
jgi:hypothetical protein